MKLKMRENNKAQPKLATANPETRESASMITKALITNKNRPKENTVAGKVRITNKGLMKTFKSAKTMATPMALVNPERYTASPKIQAVKNTLKVFTNKRNRILLIAKT